jgi:5'-nucleotidase
VAQSPVTLNIVHVNDIHANFEEVNAATGRCHPGEELCFGGMARMYTKIHELAAEENMLLLNAGDYYQGTIWYSLFKYEPVAEFGNMLNYTAMALGNHDFDDGIDGLKPFADMINFDLLASNLVETPDNVTTVLKGNNTKKSTVVQVGSVKVSSSKVAVQML